MMTRRGMEAINFLVGSTLAKELVKLFQEVMDYRDSLDFSKVDPKKIREKRIKAVYDYVTEKMAPEMIKIISKETSLEVTKLHFTGTMFLSGLFAVMLDFDNLESSQIIKQRQTGNWSFDWLLLKDIEEDSIDKSVLEMTEMSNKLDLKTGKLSGNMYGPGNIRKIRCELYMDAMMAFLLHDFIPVHIAPHLSAEELAAIYLHEIGHVLTVVERSDHAYYTVLRETEHLQQLMKAENKKEIFQEFVKVGVPRITEIMKQKEVDPKIATAYLKAVNTVSYLLEKEESNLAITVIELLLLTGFHLMILGTNLIITVTIRIPQQAMVMALINEFGYIKAGVKVSDLHQTHHNKYSLEQRADEFVSRHGMGKYIASALIKFNDIFLAMSVGQAGSVALRRSTMFNAYLKTVVFLLKVTGMTIQLDHTYEHRVERISRLVQNARAVFKNDLDKSVLDANLKDYEELEDHLKKMKSQLSHITVDIFYKYFLEYTNYAVFLSMATTGRMLNDYEKHQNQIEDLINNKLYYTSSKFRQLANRKV